MLRLYASLALMPLLTPPLVAPVAAAEPSFDCRAAQTARELATCSDAKLAAADRDMAGAWKSALAHLDQAMAKALREDQKKFLDDLDEGFNGEVWGKAEPPDLKDVRAQVARLAHRGNDSPLPALQAQLRERIAFLRSLTPATSFAGLWKNNNAELLIAPAAQDRHQVTFGLTSYGWDKYHCHFNAAFNAADKDLVASVVHNTDPEQKQNIAGNLRLARAGAMLTFTQADPSAGDGDQRWVCPRVPALTGPLFHTALKSAGAYRLKPDE